MCYSVGSSLTGWSVANALALYLYWRNRNYDRWNAGFIATFTLIQLLEAGLWSTQRPSLRLLLRSSDPQGRGGAPSQRRRSCRDPTGRSPKDRGGAPSQGPINSNLTELILLILLLQPCAQSFFGYQATQEPTLYYLSVICVFLLVGVLVMRILPAKPGQFKTTISKEGNLLWQDKAMSKGNFMSTSLGIFYLLGLFLPLCFMRDGRGLPLIGVALATALYSYLKAQGGGGFSSLWCYYGVLYAVVALFV